jgi:hypothetical protein
MAATPEGHVMTEEFERLRAKGCAFCGLPFEIGEKPHRDHDHQTRAFRGLTRGPCNLFLIAANTLPTARRPVAYLEERSGLLQ